MAVEAVDRAKKRTNLLAVGDRSQMLHLRRGQRIAKICGQIMLCSPSGDRVAKDAATHAAKASRRFVPTTTFDAAQNRQQLGRLDLADLAVAKGRVGEGEKPLCLVESDLAQPSTFPLLKPFLGDVAERRCSFDLGLGLLRLALGAGIDSVGEQFAGSIAPIQSLGQAHVG
jgi:hypothetical protein